MPRRQTVDAIVLRTYDVGEADRFCILFTRERGRITARAYGVRKLISRKGGTILPYRRITLELQESGGTLRVTSAATTGASMQHLTAMASFLQAQQGVELLLALVQHEEPLPEIFDLLKDFLERGCAAPSRASLLAFSFRLLALLGLLPERRELQAFAQLTEDELRFIEEVTKGVRPRDLPSLDRLQRLCGRFVQDHLSSPLKSPSVASSVGPPMAGGGNGDSVS